MSNSSSNQRSNESEQSSVIVIDIEVEPHNQNHRRTSAQRGIGGAKRKSKVWDYFTDDTNGEKVICQIKSKNGTICGKHVIRNTSVMENHLKHIHPSCIAPVVKAKQERKETRKEQSAGQVTIAESFDRGRAAAGDKYSSGHPKQAAFSHNLTLLLAGTSIPYQIVDDPLFKGVIQSIDPKICIPNRQAVSKSIRETEERLRSSIKTLLGNLSHLISLSADIWSRRGLTSSFLGITAHFFSQDKNGPRCVLLAMPKFEKRHSAENILELMENALARYGLSVDDPRVFRIVTDNGSNIKKALEEVEDLLFEAPGDAVVDTQQSPLESIASDPANIDMNFEAEDAEVNSEVAEFDGDEEVHFNVFGVHKRLACIDHSLTCAIRSIIDKHRTVIGVKKAAFKLIRSINSSTIAVEFLLQRDGKKPILPPSHRWVYTYYALDRLLLLRDGITELARQHETVEENLLTGPQWRQVIGLTALLKPIANFVKDLEGENYVTISRVLPALFEIEASLEEVSLS